jgi:hypothetical protein
MRKLSYVIVLGSAALCFGDTLTLKSGETIEGNYLGGTARVLRMEVNGRIQSYDVSSVTGLQFVHGSSGGASDAQFVPPPVRTPLPENARNGPDNARNGDDRPVLRRPSDSGGGGANPGPLPSPDDNRILRPEPPQYSSSAPGPQQAQSVEIPAGTQLTVRMIDSVDSEVARLGDTFRASLDEPVMLNGQPVIPRGADVVAKLVEDQKSGKIAGKTVLSLALVTVKVNDRLVDITTQDVVKESSSRGSRSAKVIGGTAAVGAIIGAVAGGGKGAAIGAGSGAAVGTGAEELGKGQRVKVPSETRLIFTLSYNVRI